MLFTVDSEKLLFEMNKLPELYLNRAKGLLYPLGIWLPPANHRLAYVCITAFIVTFQYTFLIAQITYIAQVWGDLDAMAECSYLFCTQACMCYKMTAFLMKRKTLTYLLNFMDIDIFKPKNTKHEHILQFQAKRIKRICLFFLLMAYLTTFLCGLVPLFDAAEPFPFKLWMPVNKDNTMQYLMGYSYQLVLVVTSASIFNGVDGVALCSMIFAVGQLLIIKDKILSITATDSMSSIMQTLPLSKRSSSYNNYQELSECIYQHQTLIRFINHLEDAYHLNIFFQVSASAGMICISGLRLSTVEPNSMQFASMISYLLCILLQLYTYCWCGHELTITSQELRDVLYLCPWYSQNKSFNKSLWIAMERMKQPIVFRTGKVMTLSLQTFVSILRTSYSYFAVLKQVQN